MAATLDSEARAFAATCPKHDGGTWHLFCASLMYRMCAAYGTAPDPVPATAWNAGNAAGRLGTKAEEAPAGAFHYWTIGVDGHVGLDTTGGGQSVFMASKYLRESLGDCIGFNSVEGYSRGIYPYRGWSMLYGKNGHVNVPIPPTIIEVRQWNGDQSIIESSVEGSTPVTYDVLRWAIYKLEHRKV
jgi:hypothetical protein